MTKSDLKTGMVVRLRNGDFGVFTTGVCYMGELGDMLIACSHKRGIHYNIEIEYYSDSLRYTPNEGFDIMGIYKLPDLSKTPIWKRKDNSHLIEKIDKMEKALNLLRKEVESNE